MRIVISKADGGIESIKIKGIEVLRQPLSVESPFLSGQLPKAPARTVIGDRSASAIRILSTREYKEVHQITQFTFNDATLLIEVTLTNRMRIDKEIRTDYRILFSDDIQNIFFPDGKDVRSAQKPGKEFLIYRKDLAVPLTALYGNADGPGLSIYSPFEIRKPMLKFLRDERSMIVSYQNLRLTGGGSLKTAIGIVPHGGDWRPGLEALLEMYPQYFYPAVDATLEGEGWYYLSDAFDGEQRIKELRASRVTWTELHGHFPFYGLYMPDVSEWGIIFDSGEYSLNDWNAGSGRKTNNYARMKATIDTWHKHGIQVYLYFQCFEAWHEYAEKYFGTSVARDEYGNPLPAWKFTHLMNPFPGGAWGKHIEHQVRELLRRYPAVDGIFYDRMDYWHTDFSHDDGITMVKNKKAYTLAFAQQEINEVIFEILHEANKGVWGNGPASIELCKNLDGVMAERYASNLFRLQYLAVARPFIFLAYDRQPRETEEKLKNALLCGAFPSVTYGDVQCQQIDAKYRPLFDILKSRKWVLTEHALELPDRLRGNIFQTPDGDYVVVIVDPEASQLAAMKPMLNVPVVVRIPLAAQIRYAYLLSADWPSRHELTLTKRGGSIHLSLPKHLTASAVLLTNTKQ